MSEAPAHQTRHLAALGAGVIALATAVWAPAGMVGDLLMVTVALCALLFALEASRRPGPLRWGAIVGALLAGLSAIVAAAILVVALARLTS